MAAYREFESRVAGYLKSGINSRSSEPCFHASLNRDSAEPCESSLPSRCWDLRDIVQASLRSRARVQRVCGFTNTPPSATMLWPVTNEARSEQRKATTSAISEGSARRRMAWVATLAASEPSTVSK